MIGEKSIDRDDLPRSLEEHGIYALLDTRADGTWHCAFYVPDKNSNVVGESGRKMHAVNRTGAWFYESISHNISKSPALSLAARIGKLPPDWDIAKLDEYLQDLPMSPAPFDEGKTFTCRIWFRAAVAKLHGDRLIFCPDIDLLEEEIRSFAKESDPVVWAGGPANFIISTRST